MVAQTGCMYLGIHLETPVVVGACPLTMEPESQRQLIACGAGAIVLPSIFQEQLGDLCRPSRNRLLPSALGRVRQPMYKIGPDQYLSVIRETKRRSSIPVFASMNGYSDGPWLDYAQRIEESGADALELNLQPALADPRRSADDIETDLITIVSEICESVSIPVAVKTNRNFTNLANVVQRIHSAGASGVVLFAHEFRWDVSLDELQWTTHWELTPVDSLGATISGIVQARAADLDLSLAASGGVRTADDAVKAMIAGANVVMIASEIYRSGASAVSRIVEGLGRFLETSGFPTLADFREARPAHLLRSPQKIRGDYLVPLTSSATFRDPTPALPLQTGDRYGHRH